MKLSELGYNESIEKVRQENDLADFTIGRVTSEHKERYTVKTEEGELSAEITGNLRFAAESREDYPAVGDWVALSVTDPEFSIIYSILPRYSVLSRRMPGQQAEKQVIAANIDYALIVQAADRSWKV